MAETQTQAYPTEGAVGAAPQKRRDRRGKRRGWRRSAITVGLGGVVLLGGIGTSLQSPLPIRSVEIVGASPDLSPQIAAAAGVGTDQSFASIDVGDARERIAAIAGIESVQLRWAWWNRLIVAVDEQQPVALVASPAGGFAVLDAMGETIRSTPERPAGLVVLETELPGGRTAGLAVAAALPPDMLPHTDAVLVSGEGRSVALRMATGAIVTLGEPTALPQKFTLAWQLLTSTGATQVNVSVPQRPALVGVPEPVEDESQP